MNEGDTKALAEELERFHALIYLVTSAKRVDSPIPTKIIAFRHPRQLHQFVHKRAVGQFEAGVRENRILLSDYSRRLGASEIILHEYVHFVVCNGTDAVYPIWYDEGFAEFLSTAKIRDDMMAIGIIPESRIPSFRYGRWLPMSQIISGKSYSDFPPQSLHMLYAEAWALVHYLTLGRPGGADMSRELGGYLLRVESGLPADVAFENAFGLSVEEADDAIRTALQSEEWRIVGLPLSDLEYDRSEPIVETPSKDEVAVHLGQLSLSVGESAEAESYFAAAIALNPNNSRAHAGRGDALKFQDQWDAAAPHFLRALEIDSDHALNLLDQAEYLHDLAESGAHPLQHEELLLEARGFYVRSLEIDPTSPEALSQLGRSYLNLGDDPAKGIEMIEHAFEILPSSFELSRMLSWAYIATGQDEKAREILTKFIAVRVKGELDVSLEKQIAEIRSELSKKKKKTPKSEEDDGP